jgi:hypothetical protein
VAADGLVELVEDRPCRQQVLGSAEAECPEIRAESTPALVAISFRRRSGGDEPGPYRRRRRPGSGDASGEMEDADDASPVQRTLPGGQGRPRAITTSA